jgi:hypothetical protein
VLERPDVFGMLADLDDEALNLVLAEVGQVRGRGKERRRPKSR